MKPLKGHACAKFLLLGEHFVVTGTPALAFPIRDLWCEVSVEPASHPRYEASFPANGYSDEVESIMARALYAAADSLRIDVAGQPLHVTSASNFPIARGFGSSASFAIALGRALAKYRETLSPEKTEWSELIRAVTAVEKIFHGQPSGVDAAVIFAEHPIRFEKGAIKRDLVNKAADLVVVDSGSRDQCSSMVEKVGVFRRNSPEQWDRMSAVVSGLVDRAEKALNGGDTAEVATCVQKAHSILADLELSTPAIDELIGKATGLGALAGKVSGAGGGGAVVLVAKPGAGEKLAADLRGTGLSVVAVVPATQTESANVAGQDGGRT